ncbi:hypothetical protein KGM_209215A, partial [Danaus plexippus plexippus]
MTDSVLVVEAKGGGRRDSGEGTCACACPPLTAPPAPPHPLRALDDMPPVLRSNPLYTEEEEQEVVIIVDSLESSEEVEPARVPRRAPSTSSGYGSGGGSHGRVSPTLPKTEQYDTQPIRLNNKNDGSNTSDSEASPSCTLSRSLKDDIRACLGGCREFTEKPAVRWEKDITHVVEAAVRGAGGISAARARLHAALLALHEPNNRTTLPYCGTGVRPGDVTMMSKTQSYLV